MPIFSRRDPWTGTVVLSSPLAIAWWLPRTRANPSRCKKRTICVPVARGSLARFSHHLTAEARDKPAITALRLLAVLNVLFKYASARRAARALY